MSSHPDRHRNRARPRLAPRLDALEARQLLSATPVPHAVAHRASHAEVRTLVGSPHAPADAAHAAPHAGATRGRSVVHAAGARLVVPGRKGIQAIELARWSDRSVTNFLSVVKRPDAPPEIEVAFVPVFNRANPYGNAGRVVNELLAAGKRVTVTVHLGFHLSATDPNSAELRQLRADAKAFNDGFLQPFGSRPGLTIKLSPSLEDTWRTSDDFLRAARIVASQLGPKFDAINLRRSAVSFDGRLPNTLTVTNAQGRSATLVLQREYHGDAGGSAGYNAFSNDGFFVYFDGDLNGDRRPDETPGSLDAPGTKRTVAGFTQSVLNVNYRDAVLLWRPAYNLFVKRSDPVKGATYTKVGNPESRVDSDRTPAFDATEQAVLKQFLGMS